MIPRPTFGPLAGRRSRALARRAAPAALARLAGGGRRVAARRAVRRPRRHVRVRGPATTPAARHCSRPPTARQGRRQLERQVEVLAALHADARLGPWARLVPRTLGVGDVDGLHFVLESRLPGADCRRLPARGARPGGPDGPASDRRAGGPHRQRRPGRRRHARPMGARAGVAGARGGPRRPPRRPGHGGGASWSRSCRAGRSPAPGRTATTTRRTCSSTNGRVSGVVDWTEGEPDGLVGADAVTLLLFERILAGQRARARAARVAGRPVAGGRVVARDAARGRRSGASTSARCCC